MSNTFQILPLIYTIYLQEPVIIQEPKLVVKHREVLTVNQIHILKLLYKFRFLTIPLLAKYKSVNSNAIYKALDILINKEYVLRRYDKSYKLLGKGAVYFLAPKALRFLRDEHGYNQAVLHAMYKNKTVSDPFLDYHINIAKVALKLRELYPDQYHIFTASEIHGLDQFITPLPSLYLKSKVNMAPEANDLLIDVITDTQKFILRKRLMAITEHIESTDWENTSGTSYPTWLFVCVSGKVESQLALLVPQVFSGIDEGVTVRTTSLKSLLSSPKGDPLAVTVLAY